MSSIADALLGKDAAVAFEKSAGLAKRVHRCGDDEEELVPERDEKGAVKPIVKPFLVGDGRGELLATRATEEPGVRTRRKAKEEAMPRGIYKRKKKSAAAGEASTPQPAKRARRANGATTREAHFVVDEVGQVTIIAGDGAKIELTLPDTKRLAGFIDRTKAFRA
jgi:hypothetical protein